MRDKLKTAAIVAAMLTQAGMAQPALTATLPARAQSLSPGDAVAPAVHRHGLAQQQAHHHPGQGDQVPLVDGAAVLMQQLQQLSMKSGVRIHWAVGLVSQPQPLTDPLPSSTLRHQAH